MAPPENGKGVSHHSANETEAGGDADVPHPCDGSDANGLPAVDQEHKACDEHTQGEQLTYSSVGVHFIFLEVLHATNTLGVSSPLVYADLGHIGCDADIMDTVDQVCVIMLECTITDCLQLLAIGRCIYFPFGCFLALIGL